MKISITCYSQFRDYFGDLFEVEVPNSATIHEVIRLLAQSNGEGGDLLVDKNGIIHEYVMIIYQGMRIIPSDADSYRMNDGDTLILFPPVSGG